MDTINQIQEEHTAGPQTIGFDYQFYYFMFLILELKLGQKIGFEVKDDIHIEKEDGTILFQTKHGINQEENGNPKNLTTLDHDLWKTLSNWTDMIKADEDFLLNHSFCLVTNKGENNNKLIDALTLFKRDGDADKVLGLLRELRDKTSDAQIKSYIRNALSLKKKKTGLFFQKLSIETNTDDIIKKVKDKILERILNDDLVNAVFDSLSSNLNQTKYLDIKNRRKFEISCSDFRKNFGKCFRMAFENRPLPKRKFSIVLPDNLEEQTFIKQLLDIGEIDIGKDSSQIIKYTTQMLQLLNNLSDWIENNLVLPTEMEEFNRESILIWENAFRERYRQIEKQMNTGITATDLEDEIKNLALDLIDFLRQKDLPVAGHSLGIELSNGHYYALSNTPDIGWHFDWERKYKST